MQLSRLQAELVLKNLRDRMNTKVRKVDGGREEYCRASVRLTSTELYAYDLALESLKMEQLAVAEKLFNEKMEKANNEEDE